MNPRDGRRRARRLAAAAGLLLAWLVGLLAMQVVTAGPAAAHAELVRSTPADGAQLAEAPGEVTLEFTESVGLVTEGLQLLDADGDPVDTPEPVAEGSTVRWPMPADLPDGGYLVNWRVISGDSHPVAGAFSFGVGAPPPPVQPGPTGNVADAPWQVAAARFGGYLGFTVATGVVALVIICWTGGRRHRRIQALLRAGLVIGVVATVAGLLLQGPYAAGEPLTRLLDRDLLGETTHSSFGAWTQLRLWLLLTMTGILWPLGALESRLTRWLAVGGVLATAVTFTGTGHAASGGALDRAVDTVHVLSAGVWLGGLVALTLAAAGRGERPGVEAFARFSELALLSVVALVATGTGSALLRLDDVESLWRTGYGRLLLLKLALIAATLTAAAFSRARVRGGGEPWGTVRFEATATVAVLAVTAVLASTAPPSKLGEPPAAAAQQSTNTTVEMSLGESGSARLEVRGIDTHGSTVLLALQDRTGEPIDAATVKLQATLPGRDLGPLKIPLTRQPTGWTGDFTFPLPGLWKLTLTVEDRELSGLVTAGDVRIGT